MQLNCPHCNASIHSDDVNLDSSLAKCRSCHAVFDFSKQVAGGGGHAAGEVSRPRMKVDMPSGFTVDDQPDALSITRRWFGPVAIFLLFFAIFWDGFLVVWYFIAFTDDSAPLMMKLFPILHVLVGLGLTYVVVAMFVNTTKITVDLNRFTIEHGPMPWPGNRTLDPAQIDQLYCKEKISRNKNGVSYSYELHARTIGGETKKLVSGMQKPEQALFLEQELERWLGLKDQAIPGEMAL